jgi:hypothetical protein
LKPTSREAVVLAIQRFAQEVGRPPTAEDWNPAQARERCSSRLAEIETRWAKGYWPSSSTVQLTFGSWANAIEAAGFHRPSPGTRYRTVEDVNPQNTIVFLEGQIWHHRRESAFCRLLSRHSYAEWNMTLWGEAVAPCGEHTTENTATAGLIDEVVLLRLYELTEMAP